VDMLLVNDGSTDASASIIDAFINSRSFSTRAIDQPNRGQSAARNAGLRAITTPWVMLLDADDELLIDPVHFVELNPNATSLLFSVQLKQHEKHLVRIKPAHITRDSHADILTANSPFFPSGFCFRRDLLRTPFDETYGILEDWPGWLLNPDLFDDMRVFPHVTIANIHIHGRNLSAQYERRGRMRVQIAQDLLHRLAGRLTKKQRNNLILQQRIGQLQLGEAIPSSTFFKVPVDPVLYVKLWIYSLFKDRLGKLEPYGAATRALGPDAAAL
jgi:glycosyltransferase involved in cell wall biosynthesis